MVINNQYYDWGFQTRLSAMDIILLIDIIYSIMEEIVPSRCRLMTRHLGAILFKLRLHQMCKSHVAASMHHNTWGLMQSHFYWPYWRPDSSYHNEPALGGYTLLFKYTWSYLQSPCPLLHNDPALGGYTGWSFYEHKAISSPRLLQAWQPGTWGLHMWNTQFGLVIEINNMDFFKVIIFLLKQVLSHYFVLLKTWGLQVIWIWGREIFKILSFDPASATIMTWHHLLINSASFFIFKAVEGLMSISRPIFLSIWELSQMNYSSQSFSMRNQCQQIDYEVGSLTQIFEGGNNKELRMTRCRLTRIFNPERNLLKLFLCFVYKISLTSMNPN